jgi:hypothetical protein
MNAIELNSKCTGTVQSAMTAQLAMTVQLAMNTQLAVTAACNECTASEFCVVL